MKQKNPPLIKRDGCYSAVPPIFRTSVRHSVNTVTAVHRSCLSFLQQDFSGVIFRKVLHRFPPTSGSLKEDSFCTLPVMEFKYFQKNTPSPCKSQSILPYSSFQYLRKVVTLRSVKYLLVARSFNHFFDSAYRYHADPDRSFDEDSPLRLPLFYSWPLLPFFLHNIHTARLHHLLS